MDRGTALALAGVALFVVTVAASALLAPSLTAGSRAGAVTLVGSHLGASSGVSALNGSAEVWRTEDAEGYFDVEPLSDGRLLAAFVDTGYERCGRFEPPCARTGYRLIDPDSDSDSNPDPTVVEEYTFPVRSLINSEVHAVEPLPDGGVAFTDMEYERLVVVENGSVAWEWSAASVYDSPPDPTRVDWLHINDVDRIGEGRFLVSVRNANQLLVVERGEGVVEIVNEDRSAGNDGSCRRDRQLEDYDGDGDVRCGDPDLFRHQHNPHWLGEGRLLVADSENDRVVELRRENGTWVPVWGVHSAGNLPFDWPRDADRLPNGHTLVTDSFNRRVVELDTDGSLVWSVPTAATPYEADRLPEGEPVGPPRYEGNQSVPVSIRGEIPGLSTLVFALHAAVPELPFWVGELQVLTAGLSAVLVLVGVVLRYRD